jgi:hypothetical protein
LEKLKNKYMDYIYDIKQFYWNKAENTFFGDAQNLVAELTDGTFHPEAFPNGKEKFIIKNFRTDNFRVFKFVDEVTEPAYFPFEGIGDVEILLTNWNYISEDGIKVCICVDEQ